MSSKTLQEEIRDIVREEIERAVRAGGPYSSPGALREMVREEIERQHLGYQRVTAPETDPAGEPR